MPLKRLVVEKTMVTISLTVFLLACLGKRFPESHKRQVKEAQSIEVRVGQ